MSIDCSSSLDANSSGVTRGLGETIRTIIKQYSNLGMWTAALFYADKLNALNACQVEDEICLVANCMLQKGEYHRAAHTVMSRGLHKKHLMSYYVASRAFLEAKEYQETLQLLDECDPEELSHVGNDPPKDRVLGAIAVVRGRALGALDRQLGAVNSFIHALHKDVFCFEALHYITRHHMLTPQQELELLDCLPFDAQCNRGESNLIKIIYHNELNRYGSEEKDLKTSLASTPLSEQCGVIVDRLMEHSSDTIEVHAKYLLHRGEFEACLNTLGSPEGDSERAAELRTACLTELKKPPALFSLAHRLVDKYPQSAISWFAIGCYYYIIGKNECARRYLTKATTLDRGMGAAWLAYGHSFAADNEHDQAMAAYFKARQFMSGCHSPLLYIGLECGLTNNPNMANKFFKHALQIAPKDVYVSHEKGVIAFQNQQYEEAEKLFRSTLIEVNAMTKNRLNEQWQPLLNNLGHACRKNKNYTEAIAFHQQALTLIPRCGATYSALGLCFALTGEIDKAIDAFHSSLSRRPDEPFATTMIKYLVEDLTDRPIFGDEDVPDFPFPKTLNIPVSKHADVDKDDKTDHNVTCTSDMSMSFDE